MTRDRAAVFGNGGESRLRDAGRLTALLGPGLGLAILLRFHPAVGDAAYDTLAPVAESWLTLHLLLLLSFGLLGLSLSLLLQGCSGPVATVGRVGVGVYLVFYIAFESIAGVATGVLVRTGEGLPAEQEAGIREAVAVIYAEPVGGFAGLFAVVGFVGYVVAVVAIAVAKRRDGAPAAPSFCSSGRASASSLTGVPRWIRSGYCSFRSLPAGSKRRPPRTASRWLDPPVSGLANPGHRRFTTDRRRLRSPSFRSVPVLEDDRPRSSSRAAR
ncbi:hypothetical protein ACFQL4_10765 [Halosimplex aquaticum]